MKPITDIAIVPRQPRWPVRLDPVAPPSLRKVARNPSPSTTTEQAMEPHTITDMECHPLADIFPMISEEDLTFLADDIKANGLLTPIVTFEDKVLDGRNRLKACQMAGVDPVFRAFEGDDPVTFVISANLHRRHLTTPQRKQVAAEILKRQPERSNRSVAAEVKLDAKTVAEVRQDAEACEEIPHIGPTERIDAGGRNRARKTVNKPTTPPVEEPKPAVEEPRAPEQPKVVTTDDLRTWIDLKPALPMSELFTALWDCMSGGERLTVHELVASDEWRSSRPPAIDRQPQQNRPRNA